MGLKLNRVVPWGRCLDEYCRMFNLAEAELSGHLLDCGGGPASFNAEMTQRGYRVTSCDPIYQFSSAAIRQRIQETYDTIMDGVRKNRDCYIWREIADPEALGRIRMATMAQFLTDFPQGLTTGRYQVAALPDLPFGDRQFDLALCSHLLFTYSQHLSLSFHQAAIDELCRVAAEVRIFPLLQLDGTPSPWLAPVLNHLQNQGIAYGIHPTSYEFQIGGNQLLQVIVAKRS